MIRSLDIGPRERWTRGRLPIHVALATLRANEGDTALPRGRRPRLLGLWKFTAWLIILPCASALGLVVALRILRSGLL